MLKQKKFKREFSAGCVVFKPLSIIHHPLSIKYLLGRHSGYHKWVLPKGLIEKDEKGWQTALRETEEEMGVRGRLLSKKPIHIIKYIYVADLEKNIKNEKLNIKNTQPKNIYLGGQANEISNINIPKKRIAKYQESGGKKTRVFKTVSFYLTEYEKGDPKEHDWEMEEAGWYSFETAMKKLAFKGEKEALEKAKVKIAELQKQPKLI